MGTCNASSDFSSSSIIYTQMVDSRLALSSTPWWAITQVKCGSSDWRYEKEDEKEDVLISSCSLSPSVQQWKPLAVENCVLGWAEEDVRNCFAVLPVLVRWVPAKTVTETLRNLEKKNRNKEVGRTLKKTDLSLVMFVAFALLYREAEEETSRKQAWGSYLCVVSLCVRRVQNVREPKISKKY